MPTLIDTEYPLTETQIAEYRRNGFISLPDVITGDDLAAIRDAVAGAVEQENKDARPVEEKTVYGQIFIQRVNLWERHESVRSFVLSPRFANIAARLEGQPMRLWHDQALFKEPKKGAKTPWHQDSPYWPLSPRTHCTTIWLALQDATAENGCLTFIPGTHLEEFKEVDLTTPDDLFEFAPKFKGIRGEVCELKAGSATFHNGLTFHYAGPNKSAAMREAFAIIFMPDGTRFNGAVHMCTENKGLNVGDPLDGKDHPVVSTVE
jgi:ectoine hydroxylase-related dioxygenase (phytanoyl-CoA dioxygenase family)